MPPEMMDNMADGAGSAATEAYEAAIEGGADPADAFAAATEAASSVMQEMGAPAEMVEGMVDAASEGFNNAIEGGADPMEAFDAAGNSVDQAMDMGPDTAPQPGMEGDMAGQPGMEGDMAGQPGMEGPPVDPMTDMAPPDPTGELAGSENIAPMPEGMDDMASHMDQASADTAPPPPEFDDPNPAGGFDGDVPDAAPPPPENDTGDDIV